MRFASKDDRRGPRQLTSFSLVMKISRSEPSARGRYWQTPLNPSVGEELKMALADIVSSLNVCIAPDPDVPVRSAFDPRPTSVMSASAASRNMPSRAASRRSFSPLIALELNSV
jgi:hypothetical protein